MMDLPPRLATSTAGVAVAAAAIAAAATTTVAAAITTAGGSAVAASKVAGRTVLGASETTAEATTTAAATAAILAEIGVAAAATTTATTTTATTATTEGGLAGDGLEEARNLLVGLLEQVDELTDDTAVATVEEGSGNTCVTGTTGTTDTVDVVINIGGKIIVDDVSDVRDIQATGSNGGGNEDRALAVAEELKGALTLTLSAVAMNRGGREVLVDQEVRQRIGHALRLNKDESEAAGVGVEDIEENRALVNILDILDLLSDVLRGGADTTDREEDVVAEEVLGKHLDVAGEGGREHEGLALAGRRHVLTLDDAANLGLETHVKHTISLVEDEVLDVAQRDATTLYEVDKSAGSGNKEIAATLDLAKLGADIGTTIDDARTDPRAVGELASLIVDLGNQLTSGSQDQSSGISLALTAVATAALDRDRRGALGERLVEDGEQETASLAGTSLGAGHEIAAVDDDGDRVLLDRGGDLVAGELNVGEQVLVQRGVAEGEDGLGHITARGRDGDVVILLEVDTGVLLARVVGSTEELTLHARVTSAGNVLPINPASLTATNAAAATAAHTAGIGAAAIGVAVEAALSVAPGLRRRLIITAPVTATGVEVVVTSRTSQLQLEIIGVVNCNMVEPDIESR